MTIWDWDESDAFCNIPRADLPAVVGAFAPGAGEYLEAFYAQLKVYVVTPYGLAGPYRLQHGGAQGDSGGVAAYTLCAVVCTSFH